MVCADFASYLKAQTRAAKLYHDQDAWTTSSIINTARSGHFSTDRTIAEYNRDIWRLPTVPAIPI
jgi:starch phosphorylase